MSLCSSGCERLAAKGRRKRSRSFEPELGRLLDYWWEEARIGCPVRSARVW